MLNIIDYILLVSVDISVRTHKNIVIFRERWKACGSFGLEIYTVLVTK